MEEEASKAADSDNVVVGGSGLHYHINGSRTDSFGWREFVDRPYLDRLIINKNNNNNNKEEEANL